MIYINIIIVLVCTVFVIERVYSKFIKSVRNDSGCFKHNYVTVFSKSATDIVRDYCEENRIIKRDKFRFFISYCDFGTGIHVRVDGCHGKLSSKIFSFCEHSEKSFVSVCTKCGNKKYNKRDFYQSIDKAINNYFDEFCLAYAIYDDSKL